MNSSLKKNIISGSLWAVSGQLFYLSVIFIANIWLARLLSPADFGQIGIIMFFITVANVLTESGLGGALIRKKAALKEDYSTVFIFNLLLSFVCYLLLVLSAGFVAEFYNDNQLKDLLIVSGLVLIINSFQITQNAKLVSEMRFKRRSFCRLISAIVGAFVGVGSAYMGFGVWSLVYMQLSISVSITILYWMYEGMFFSLTFSNKSFKELFGFGVNTTLASLLNTAFDNIYQLILGRYFAVSQVGYYYQAKRLQDVPGGIINMLSQSVIFSSLAKLQDDKEEFYRGYKKIVLIFLVLLGFISSFIYIYAEPIILLLYGDKWLGAVFYMQLLTIASFFYYQELINRLIFKIFNRTRLILYLELFKKSVQIISIIIGVYYLNIEILIIGFVITSLIGYLINYYYSRKILNVESEGELIIVLKVCIISILITFLISYINVHITTIYLRFATFPLFIVSYIVGLYVFRVINRYTSLKELKQLKDILKK